MIIFVENPAYDHGESKDDTSLSLNNCTGVIDREKMLSFEKMLWRVSKGNVYVRFCDIDEEMKDPKTGDDILKSVFIIFYQVQQITFNPFLLFMKFEKSFCFRLEYL